jgi:hypothetical protein
VVVLVFAIPLMVLLLGGVVPSVILCVQNRFDYSGSAV